MRTVLFVALCLAGMAMAREIDDSSLGTMDTKKRQTVILKLLNHVTEPLMYKELDDIGKNFKIEKDTELFTRPDVVKGFLKIIKVGTLPRGEIFTLHADRQLKEVIVMFHMLYYAKDFDTFIKTACWMRKHINEGMFVYALSVAVRHRVDCKGIVLPPPYEIYPYYFVRADVIQKAYLLKMKKGLVDLKLCDFYGIKKTDKDVYIIDENIYDKRVLLSTEDTLRYFTEDIDLNTYYYHFHVDYPFWMKDAEFNKEKIRRFELTMHVYHQIVARYYLERLSNGLGHIDEFSWHHTIDKGYWPWLQTHNGIEMPARMNKHVIVQDKNLPVIRLCEEYERIIRESIIKGFIEINGMRLEITKQEDMEKLGQLIYGKVDKTVVGHLRVEAYRYLLIVMKVALGFNTLNSDKYFLVPNVLDHYQTALRDPVFYRLQKRIIDLVRLFKSRLPSYTKEDLHFSGVKIENVVVDQLITYFDDYLMDMTNAVALTDEELKKTKSDMVFLVRKRRLNHKKFTVTLDILSDKTVDSVVRIFLGPKKDHLGRLIDINVNRLNFVELDTFPYKLNTGKNEIVRHSDDMQNIVKDRVMTRDLWKKLESRIELRDLLDKDLKNFHTGFPARLLLPKGRVSGMEMVLYVLVTPIKVVENLDNSVWETTRKDRKNSIATVLLDKPLGFPLDRHMDIENFFTPNMKFIDVVIFHKKTVCDMKTRWQRWVLKDYDMVDRTPIADTYFVDTDINIKVDRDD